MMIGLIAGATLMASLAQYPGQTSDWGSLRRRMAELASGEYAARVRAEEAAAPIVLRTDQDFRTAARREILNSLREPSSAQFRNVWQSSTSIGGAKFCGEINSRNGFGGYTGYVRFMAFAAPSGRTSAELDNQNGMVGAAFDGAWNLNCGSQDSVAVRF